MSSDEAVKRTKRAQTDERRRVQAIIDRDAGDAAREDMRKAAEVEVKEGSFVHLDDTVVAPTREWSEKGDVERYTPKAPDGTVRSVTTVRRVITPIVVRMHRAGKMSDEHALACLWYRQTYELAGIEGHSASSQWNPNSTIRRGAVEAGFGYVPTSEAVAEARDAFRAARAALPAFYMRFFEAIVLNDVPLRRASRFAKCRDDRAPRRFRDVADVLFDHCAKAKVSMPQLEDEKSA